MAIVGVVAVAGLGFLGYQVLRSGGELDAEKARQAAAAGPQPTVAAGPADAESSEYAEPSRMVIVRGGKLATGRPALVALARPAPTGVGARNDETRQGLLARELVRQAVLIAARDELGLVTRDEVIGDNPVADDGKDSAGDRIEVVPRLVVDAPSRLVIRRTQGSTVEDLLDRELGTYMRSGTMGSADGPKPDDLGGLAEAAEAASRSEIPAVLRKLGLESVARPARQDAALPEGVDEALSRRLGYCEPLAAVRAIHAAIQADGESPQRLGGLARGYALLGVLTEFHWHPAHKAFKARALLYAQRLCARYPGDPLGPWSRAHARALAGLHQAALDDLAAASKAAGGRKPPGWVELVDAMARCDASRLAQAAGRDDQGPLAALMRMLILEYPPLGGVTLEPARAVLSLDPDCYRACDAMCLVDGLSNQHQATLIGPKLLEGAFPGRLESLGSALPESVHACLGREDGPTPALVAALREAGDPSADGGEPSWSVLGHMVAETRFVHAYRRLRFMSRVWGVPVDEYWAEAEPTVAGHRHRALLDEYLLPRGATPQVVGTFAQQADLRDIELASLRYEAPLAMANTPGGGQVADLAYRHADHVARDISARILVDFRLREPNNVTDAAWRLLAISPHSAYAHATLVARDREATKDLLARWEEQFSDSAAVVGALAKRAVEEKRTDDAIRLLERTARLAPEAWVCTTLAGLYKERGDTKRWRQTLDAFLAGPDEKGLEHAAVRVQIADDLMQRGEYKEAWPYAEAAAETWAGWAMQCAERCAEGMHDYEKAELWCRREAERYPMSWATWFLFCARTGHGDIRAARAHAEAALRSFGDRPEIIHPDIVSADRLGFYYWLTDRPKEALEPMRLAFERTPQPPELAYCILLADRVKDEASRDQAIRTMKERFAIIAPRTIKVLDLLYPVGKPSSHEPDIKAIDAVLAAISPERRGNTSFLVGAYYVNRGRIDDARPYLETCVSGSATIPWMNLASGVWLSRLDRKPAARK